MKSLAAWFIAAIVFLLLTLGVLYIYSFTLGEDTDVSETANPVPTMEFGPLDEIQIVETGETAVVVPLLGETPTPIATQALGPISELEIVEGESEDIAIPLLEETPQP